MIHIGSPHRLCSVFCALFGICTLWFGFFRRGCRLLFSSYFGVYYRGMSFRGDSLVFVRMPKAENLLALDIGSSHIRAVMAQDIPGEETLRVLGAVSLPSEGMRR